MRFILLILICLSFLACKKLDSEQVFLKTTCEDCKNEVEDHLIDVKGIHYVNYDVENEVLVFHYEGEKNRKVAENWLRNKGHIQSADTSIHITPDCCPRKDTLP